MKEPISKNTIQRIRYELRSREVRVTRVETLGPGFVRLTFGGESLADFVSASFDDHIKLIFETETKETIRRDYTPRAFDPVARELTLELGLHPGGHASAWARQARPGVSAVIGGPKGSLVIPTDFDWHILAGDSAALPAISRRLEELPAGTHAIVHVQTLKPDDRRTFRTAARLDLKWTFTVGDFVEGIRGLQVPNGNGFVWCAGEASVMASLRKLFLEEKKILPSAARIASYWKVGSAAFHENLVDPSAPPLRAVF
jgi:NADPH-dependent ferric siderophore reductase